MMQHIDVSSVLRQAVACDLYSNLVTRPTGAAVRAQIQALLRAAPVRERPLAILDFSHVRMIDFSCADEVIAKLVLPYCEGDEPEADAYFLFRGVSEAHWDAIEAVLERHALALVIEEDGVVRVAGVVEEEEQRVWLALQRLAGGDAPDVARALADEGRPHSAHEVERILERLHRRRLVMRLDDGYYLPVGAGIGSRG
ncbi:MAG TPA: hypothetical protein VEA99_16925 [Gemmatimonadaceae bacterium]|nr:hypothetical protein [Gemmatimonadaceae bacterium]